LDIRKAIDSNLVNRVWGENQIRNLESSFKQKEIDFADVAADQMIMDDPGAAVVKLANKKVLPNLPPKVRQDKIEKAKAAFKVQQNDQAKKLKEAIELAHDNEVKDISNDYMNGNFTQGFIKVLDNKLLTGVEQRTWAKSFSDAAKESGKPTDIERASEIVTVNTMISNNVEQSKINDYVVQSSNLEMEDKKQIVNKLNTKHGSEVESATKDSYRIIQDLIIPKRGMLTNLIETPSETTAVLMAQMALDEWILSETQGGKRLTGKEIKERAIALGGANQVPISQKIMEMRDEAKKTATEMKKVQELLKGQE